MASSSILQELEQLQVLLTEADSCRTSVDFCDEEHHYNLQRKELDHNLASPAVTEHDSINEGMVIQREEVRKLRADLRQRDEEYSKLQSVLNDTREQLQSTAANAAHNGQAALCRVRHLQKKAEEWRQQASDANKKIQEEQRARQSLQKEVDSLRDQTRGLQKDLAEGLREQARGASLQSAAIASMMQPPMPPMIVQQPAPLPPPPARDDDRNSAALEELAKRLKAERAWRKAFTKLMKTELINKEQMDKILTTMCTTATEYRADAEHQPIKDVSMTSRRIQNSTDVSWKSDKSSENWKRDLDTALKAFQKQQTKVCGLLSSMA